LYRGAKCRESNIRSRQGIVTSGHLGDAELSLIVGNDPSGERLERDECGGQGGTRRTLCVAANRTFACLSEGGSETECGAEKQRRKHRKERLTHSYLPINDTCR